MKKILKNTLFIELLHKYQFISFLGFTISLVAYVICLDFFHHNSIILLACMVAFIIVALSIGIFWLVKDIYEFSQTYKTIYSDSKSKKNKTHD